MKKNNFGIIIQARTNSSRFPRKIVRPVESTKTFLDILLSRLLSLKDEVSIAIATSDTEADDIIEKIGKSFGISVFRGSEDNVLNRFIQCASTFGMDKIIRICSDNPFIDIDCIKKLMSEYREEDYLSYWVNDRPSILTHYGFFSEIVSLEALKKLEKSQKEGCKEHVTNCLYTNTEEFRVRFIPLEILATHIRCTLDTEADFHVLKKIYFDWYQKIAPEKANYSNLIQYIEVNPSILTVMKNQIKQNTK